MENLTAYYAGLFDGEGTVGVYRAGAKHWCCKLSITGKHLPMIESIRDYFSYGGIHKCKRIKKSYKRGFRDQCWKWNINNKKDIKEDLSM